MPNLNCVILMACYVTVGVTAQEHTRSLHTPTQESEVKGYYTINPSANSAVKVVEPIAPRLIKAFDDDTTENEHQDKTLEQAAIVGTPEIIALHLPEVTTGPDEEPCRYTFTIPKSSQCEMPVFEPLKLDAGSEQSAYSWHQRKWIERHRPRIVQTEPVEEIENEDPSHDLLIKAFEQLTNNLKAQLEIMEREIRSTGTSRTTLIEENRNIKREVVEKQTIIDNLTTRYTQLENDMSVVEGKNIVLLTSNNQLIQRINSLEYSKVVLTEQVDSLTEEKNRLGDHVKAYRSKNYQLSQEKTIQQELLSNVTKRMRKFEGLLRTNSKIQRKPCVRRIKEEEHFNYTHCGKLVNVSGPMPIRRSGSSVMGRRGVWMKDPLSALGDKKVWVVTTIGNRIKRVRQYADMNTFSQHKQERSIMLQIPMESTTGAVVYNGSLYYQRRKSRRIVRFDLSRQQTLNERPLSKAGYRGTYAYAWGGFSDIDFAVDESGLWVIYSTPKNRGNIVVANLDPILLQPTKIINTSIDKRTASNAFIICGTLYTVNSHDQVRALIKFSFDLNTKRKERVDIPFINRYRHNVMVDYNPRDRYLYSWDDSHQVRYKVHIDSSYGPTEEVINIFNSDTAG